MVEKKRRSRKSKSDGQGGLFEKVKTSVNVSMAVPDGPVEQTKKYGGLDTDGLQKILFEVAAKHGAEIDHNRRLGCASFLHEADSREQAMSFFDLMLDLSKRYEFNLHVSGLIPNAPEMLKQRKIANGEDRFVMTYKVPATISSLSA